MRVRRASPFLWVAPSVKPFKSSTAPGRYAPKGESAPEGDGMSDTRTLLDRIASFRERLERTPNLIPVAADNPEAAKTQAVAALVGSGDLISRSLRAVAGVPVNEGPL